MHEGSLHRDFVSHVGDLWNWCRAAIHIIIYLRIFTKIPAELLFTSSFTSFHQDVTSFHQNVTSFHQPNWVNPSFNGGGTPGSSWKESQREIMNGFQRPEIPKAQNPGKTATAGGAVQNSEAKPSQVTQLHNISDLL